MTDPTPDASLPRAARVAGAAYLAIIALGLFAEMFIRARLIVPGDAAATAANIAASSQLFRVSIASDLLMLVFDVIAALALYVLLRPVSHGLSMLAAWFRLVHATIYGVTLLTLFAVLQLVVGAESLSTLGTDPTHALVGLCLDAHGAGYRIALVFFGVHCAFLGVLVWRSGYVPRVLGALMIVAAAGYLIDSFAGVLMADYERYAGIFLAIVAVPAIVAELSMALWLLIRGGAIRRPAPAAG